jgi:hypothetical protein
MGQTVLLLIIVVKGRGTDVWLITVVWGRRTDVCLIIVVYRLVFNNLYILGIGLKVKRR